MFASERNFFVAERYFFVVVIAADDGCNVVVLNFKMNIPIKTNDVVNYNHSL